MLKKLTIGTLILMLLLSSSALTFALEDKNQSVTLFSRDIYVNGEKIVNDQSITPYFSSGNHTFIPLTEENGKIFGFQTVIDAEKGTITLSKEQSSQKNYSNQTTKSVQSTFTALATEFKLFYQPDEEQEMQHVYLNNTKVYQYQNAYYVSLGVLLTIEEFGWTSHYTPYVGLYISTDPEKEAKSFVDEKLVSRNKTLVEYMMKINGGSLTEGKALNMLFMIKEKSKRYKVDELLVIALIAKESSFNEKAVAKGGALGLMQIMPATGANAGYSKAQLLTAEHNLEFGIKYLANSIKNFDGSWVAGLSAYNQGSGVVSRGSYSRAYYTKIVTAYQTLQEKVK